MNKGNGSIFVYYEAQNACGHLLVFYIINIDNKIHIHKLDQLDHVFMTTMKKDWHRSCIPEASTSSIQLGIGRLETI